MEFNYVYITEKFGITFEILKIYSKINKSGIRIQVIKLYM